MRVLAVPEAQVAGRFRYDCLVSVNRANGRWNRFEVYPRTVRQPLLWIRVPLAGGAWPVENLVLTRGMDGVAYCRFCCAVARPERLVWGRITEE
jgi:hypothetical protein